MSPDPYRPQVDRELIRRVSAHALAVFARDDRDELHQLLGELDRDELHALVPVILNDLLVAMSGDD